MRYEVWGEPDDYDCPSCSQIINERDKNEEMAEKLADAIADFFGVDIGEHVGGTPGNCPWTNALKIITDAKGTFGLYRLQQHGEKCGCADCT